MSGKRLGVYPKPVANHFDFLGLFLFSLAVFLVSVGISAERLLWKRIACADNREILVTGKVKSAFFDKTGSKW